MQIDPFDAQLWGKAIQRMPCNKATGVCGWAPSDLKLLSPAALEVLCSIFAQALQWGLPPHLLRAKVSVLAKVAAPTSIKQSRPITIFSTLYRIWASVVTRQILKQWQVQFPAAVAGSMPHRSCRDLSYAQQHKIECALVFSHRRLGASIDLVKCFNQIPWQPAIHLLVALGVPAGIASFWVDCLGKLRRHACFCGDFGPGLQCWNGAPEGCPFSVAVMAAVARCASHLCKDDIDFDTYVDNWAWAATDGGPLQQGLAMSFAFLQALRLPVDWKKSYCWAAN